MGKGSSASGAEAFIWDQTNEMRSVRNLLVNDSGLDITGWTFTRANDVSGDGLVTTPSGQTDAWLADLSTTTEVPQPTALRDGLISNLRLVVEEAIARR